MSWSTLSQNPWFFSIICWREYYQILFTSFHNHILNTVHIVLPFITTLPSIWTAWKPALINMHISLFSGLLECDMWRGLLGWAPQKWFYGSIEQIDSHEQRTWPYSRDSNCLKAKVNILWFQIIHGRLQCDYKRWIDSQASCLPGPSGQTHQPRSRGNL